MDKSNLIGAKMDKWIVVPVSGGKDSQACLKLAVEKHGNDKVIGLFCDTQWEHEITYNHVKSLSKMYGVRIDTVSGGSVEEKVLKYKRFPGFGTRFCTDELKIRETKIYLKSFAEKYGPTNVWYGMRSDESHQRRKRYSHVVEYEEYMPNEVLKKYPKYLGKLGVRFVLPILTWTAGEIIDYLGDEKNPLYDQGFDRVGCFPCLAGGDAAKKHAFNYDDFGRKQYERVVKLEKIIGKSIWTTDKYRNDCGNGCSLCSM